MVRIYVDERERNSTVPEHLKFLGVTVIFRKLSIGDYMISDEIIVERKRVDDLVKSVFDGRFFDQISKLAKEVPKPILIIEGNLKYIKNITSSWRSIRGALITVALKYNIPILYTFDAKETAETLKHIAEKVCGDQKQKFTKVPLVTKPKISKDISEWQLSVLQSLPYVGPKIAERLLLKFGTVRAVFNAPLSELARIEGLNESKALKIYQIITTPFKKHKEKAESKGKSIEDFLSS